MNVLVAEDTRTERFFINHQFAKIGIKPDIASGGKEALKLCATKKYDCVFLDTAMPEPDGAMTYERLKNNNKNLNYDTPIVYMGTLLERFPLEGTFHIKKPVTKAALLDVINKLAPDTTLPAWLYKDDMLNVDEGIRHCGSEDGYMAALDIFASTIPQKADEIQTLYDSEDYENYTIKVHALKSSARIIGANALAESAYTLEMAGKKNDIDTIKQNTEKLLLDYRRYINFFSSSEAKSDTEEKPLAPDNVISDAYASIAEFSDAMDFDLTEMVIKSLDTYKLNYPDAKRVAQIHTKLLNLDWDGIKELLTEI